MNIQEHEEIKTYLINYINILWNNNKDFVEVYGKDYPKRQLEHNLREIRFNETSTIDTSGEFILPSRNIHMYNNKHPIYSLYDLINSPIKEELMLTLLHELLHSIFGKNLGSEKDDNKLQTGLEIYDEKEGKVINSPLNEGYTEYIRSCLDGDKRHTYRPYVKVFYILEKKMGRRNVIALGKGDIVQNLSDAFDMTKDEFMEFCRYSEVQFIKERKIEILDCKYQEFCEKYPEGTMDNEKTAKAISKFDKQVHKCLYGKSIIDILPERENNIITLQEFHDFLNFKIESVYEQVKRFQANLCAKARETKFKKGSKAISILKDRIFAFFGIYDIDDEKKVDSREEWIATYLDGASYYAPTDKNSKTSSQEKESRHDSFVESIKKMANQNTALKRNNCRNLQENYHKMKSEHNDFDL